MHDVPVQIFMYLDDAHQTSADSEEWVCVFTTGTQYEAELIKGRLLQNDLPATVLNQGDSMRPFTFGSLAVYKVMVPSAFSKAAEELL